MNKNFHDYHRGEIYYADLDPVVGHEQGGFRPVLITQNEVGNYYSPTVIIVPLSRRSSKKPNQPTHVLLDGVEGLDPSLALVEQTRTLDKCRLGRYVGRADDGQMRMVDEAIRVSQGLVDLESPCLNRTANAKKDSRMVMCLCPVCRQRFLDSGAYILKRVAFPQDTKDDCTYCQFRRGYDYYVRRRQPTEDG